MTCLSEVTGVRTGLSVTGRGHGVYRSDEEQRGSSSFDKDRIKVTSNRGQGDVGREDVTMDPGS